MKSVSWNGPLANVDPAVNERAAIVERIKLGLGALRRRFISKLPCYCFEIKWLTESYRIPGAVPIAVDQPLPADTVMQHNNTNVVIRTA